MSHTSLVHQMASPRSPKECQSLLHLKGVTIKALHFFGKYLNFWIVRKGRLNHTIVAPGKVGGILSRHWLFRGQAFTLARLIAYPQ